MKRNRHRAYKDQESRVSLMSVQGSLGTSSGEVTLELSLKGVSMTIKKLGILGRVSSTYFKKKTNFEEEQKVSSH